ncbi:hypothetical protein [uncultured Ruegeria sp.]|uniref:hypothetical protein n=1 Tax=uncultured Ruegeria sp. TaxID=259304 RepID=UPI00261918BE|nr:hypothetical protein [uncultured Ruegeria sp.]
MARCVQQCDMADRQTEGRCVGEPIETAWWTAHLGSASSPIGTDPTTMVTYALTSA